MPQSSVKPCGGGGWMGGGVVVGGWRDGGESVAGSRWVGCAVVVGYIL